MIRVVLLLVVSFFLVAVGVFIGLEFSPTNNFSTGSPGAGDATLSYEANAANAENVYQQIAVGTWGTRDMLEVIANQTGGLDVMAQQLIQAQEAQVRLQIVQVVLTGLLITSVMVMVPFAITGSGEKTTRRKETKSPRKSDKELIRNRGKINSLDEDQLTDWFEADEPSLDNWDGKPSTFNNWLTNQKKVAEEG